jgi:hypothetical protein
MALPAQFAVQQRVLKPDRFQLAPTIESGRIAKEQRLCSSRTRWTAEPLFDHQAGGHAMDRELEGAVRGHEQLRAGIAALESDDELFRQRLSPFDGPQETRWIIARMMQHDLYHTGEINHIRALCQQDD